MKKAKKKNEKLKKATLKKIKLLKKNKKKSLKCKLRKSHKPRKLRKQSRRYKKKTKKRKKKKGGGWFSKTPPRRRRGAVPNITMEQSQPQPPPPPAQPETTPEPLTTPAAQYDAWDQDALDAWMYPQEPKTIAAPPAPAPSAPAPPAPAPAPPAQYDEWQQDIVYPQEPKSQLGLSKIPSDVQELIASKLKNPKDVARYSNVDQGTYSTIRNSDIYTQSRDYAIIWKKYGIKENDTYVNLGYRLSDTLSELVHALNALPNMSVLDLDRNQIVDIAPLAELTQSDNN